MPLSSCVQSRLTAEKKKGKQNFTSGEVGKSRQEKLSPAFWEEIVIFGNGRKKTLTLNSSSE
ncbi:MAG: hypothetical protein AAGI90_06690 [Chlamydiota bacterium]